MDDSPTTEIPRLHSLPEVAAGAGIPLRKLREMSWVPEFEHIKIGKERYVTDEQLRKLINQLTVGTTGGAA